jgi:hypothetical protein
MRNGASAPHPPRRTVCSDRASLIRVEGPGTRGAKGRFAALAMGADAGRRREVLVKGKRYSVFAIRTTKKHETIWIRAGVAWVNADDSMNLHLDVLPLEGVLHVRETSAKQSTTNHNQPAREEQKAETPSLEAQRAMGGH